MKTGRMTVTCLLVVGLLTGCGDDDDSDEGAATTPTLTENVAIGGPTTTTEQEKAVTASGLTPVGSTLEVGQPGQVKFEDTLEANVIWLR